MSDTVKRALSEHCEDLDPPSKRPCMEVSDLQDSESVSGSAETASISTPHSFTSGWATVNHTAFSLPPIVPAPATSTGSTSSIFTSNLIYSNELKKNIYVHEVKEGLKVNSNSSKRNKLTRDIPHPLNWPQLLTQQQLNDIDYIQMTDIPHYIRTEGRRLVPFARWFSPEETHDLGLWTDLTELQKILSAKGFEEHLRKLYGGNWSQRGRIYELGFVLVTGYHIVQPGLISKKNDPQVNRLNPLIAKVAKALLENAFPDRRKDLQHRLWTVNASFTIGSEDNEDFTGIQLNFSSVEQKLSDAIKGFGGLHIDSGDNPISYTAMFALSHLPPSVFPGRFNITSLRITCSTPPFAALVFKGIHPHLGTGVGEYPDTIDESSPLRIKLRDGLRYPELPPDTPYRRILVIPFPKMALMTWKPQFLNEDVQAPNSLGYFGTKRAQVENHVKMFIRQYHSDRKWEVEQFMRHFSWVNESGATETPRIHVVQEALDLAGKEDPELQEYIDDIKSVSCGSVYMQPREKEPVIKSPASVPHEGIGLDMEDYTAGTMVKSKKPAKKVGKKVERFSPENWTHMDYTRMFDPYTDQIPGNLSWLESLERVEG